MCPQTTGRLEWPLRDVFVCQAPGPLVHAFGSGVNQYGSPRDDPSAPLVGELPI